MSLHSNQSMEASDTHRDLIEQCRLGRRDAQFKLYRLYSRAMYNTILRMVQNTHDAEDLLQSVFVEVFGPPIADIGTQVQR